MKTLRTLTLTLGLALSAPALAQASTNAVVTTPNGQSMVMPLNVYLLPYGTLTIAPGVYFISNYENTGMSIYIQSPQPLPIATLEEMVRYQAEWTRITRAVAAPRPAPTPQAALPTGPAPQAVSSPFASQATAAPGFAAPQATALPTFPVPPAQVPVTAPVQPATMTPWSTPVQAAPLPQATFSAPPVAAPQPAPVFAAPPAPTFPTASAAFAPAAPAPLPQAAPVAVQAPALPVSAPAPAAAAMWAPATTLVPDFLRPSFRGRGTTVTYSLSNTSATQSMLLDPSTLRVYQQGQPVQAQLAVRDSTGAGASSGGVLMPRSMMVGTVQVLTRSAEPITLTWQARDQQGRVYPIAYAWMPQ
jgi:hypothetical protein